MANDRYYLVCTVCGDYASLAKYWGYDFDIRVKPDQMQEFLEKHVHTCGSDKIALANENGLCRAIDGDKGSWEIVNGKSKLITSEYDPNRDVNYYKFRIED